MTDSQTLRGMATLNFFAADMQVAKDWYTEFLGIPPYFERPINGSLAYIEFRIGDYQHELGIINSAFARHDTSISGGAVTYWHVDNLDATLEKLTTLGATLHEPITKRGDSGFVTASVIDPFGNILGIMTNPHYVDILREMKGE